MTHSATHLLHRHSWPLGSSHHRQLGSLLDERKFAFWKRGQNYVINLNSQKSTEFPSLQLQPYLSSYKHNIHWCEGNFRFLKWGFKAENYYNLISKDNGIFLDIRLLPSSVSPAEEDWISLSRQDHLLEHLRAKPKFCRGSWGFSVWRRHSPCHPLASTSKRKHSVSPSNCMEQS